jgi:hypothetical protein
MHAMLLTVFLVAGGQLAPLDRQLPPAGCEGCRCAECSQCGCESGCDVGCDVGCGGSSLLLGCLAAWLGPMPQTCYSPRFGCYPGNSRYINRYPAFDGSYYRQAYNYRQLFDYPWHATPREPQGYLLGYEGPMPPAGEPIPAPYPEPGTLLSEPLPLAPDGR